MVRWHLLFEEAPPKFIKRVDGEKWSSTKELLLEGGDIVFGSYTEDRQGNRGWTYHGGVVIAWREKVNNYE